MYNKLLIVISYYLDRFLLLSYPPSPIWGKGAAFLPSPFLLLPFSLLPQAHFGTSYLCISLASYTLSTDWISVFLQLPHTCTGMEMTAQ